MRCCRNRREIQFYCQKQTREQKPEQFKPDEGEISPSLEVRLESKVWSEFKKRFQRDRGFYFNLLKQQRQFGVQKEAEGEIIKSWLWKNSLTVSVLLTLTGGKL